MQNYPSCKKVKRFCPTNKLVKIDNTFDYGKCSKISNTFLFSNKMLVFRVTIHKMLVKIANREDPDLGLRCLSTFWQDPSV